MSNAITYTSLSVGVVTHARAGAFAKLLVYLKRAMICYPATCELVIANNSGVAAHSLISNILKASDIGSVCTYRLLDSPKNCISTGRNLVLDNATESLLVFVDDDEYPIETWLTELVDAMWRYQCDLVAGPIIPVFPKGTKTWIRSLDLHNSLGLDSGDKLDYAATGNFLMNREGVEDIRFATEFGKTGGEDTEYFLRLKDRGRTMCWCHSAIVHEDIPASKATTGYMIDRFMTQGTNYRKVLELRNELGSVWWFSIRAVVQAGIALSLGTVLLLLSPQKAGNWLKRGFSNLGKVTQPAKELYD